MTEASASRWLLMTLAMYQLRVSWCSTLLSYSVEEQLPVGTVIANLRQDADWLSRKYSTDEFYRLSFALLRLGGYSGSMADFFVVNATSGEIQTGDVIDREAICSDQTTPCVVRLDVAVQPADYFEIIRAEVTVLDVNDNEPVFLIGSSFRLTVPESSQTGATFQLPLATDPDIGENGAVEYRLNDATDHFRLAVDAGWRSNDQVNELKLELYRKLDRELYDSVRVRLLAVDRGHVPLTGSLDIEVIVGDENDNAPHFDQDEYRVEVPEDAPIGTTIARLHASDADVGENAHVRYAFSSRTAANYGDLFAIDRETGSVVLLQSLAYAPGDEEVQYHLSVVAEDGGRYPLPALSALVIRVLDINSHSPRITVDAMNGNGDDAISGTSQPEVEENRPPRTFVAHVTVTDADSGRNGIVSCELTSEGNPEEDFNLVEIYEGEYTLETTRQFDREAADHVDVAITCRDGGIPPRSTTRNVTVAVIDVNDHAPHFTQHVYEATLPENSAWGAVVTRIVALDADAGDNGRVTYLFDRSDSSSAGRRFHVDPDSGIVTTLAGLDREVTDMVEFSVVASDMASPARRRRTSRAVVRVHIADVDDESPTFLRADYVFSVSENLAAGAEVGQVSAVDLDSPPYDSFTYRLREHDPDSAYFRVDGATGSIRTAVTLDRELRRMYRMSVIAQSDTVRARSDVTVVTVHVDDVNDHSPTFIFPNSINNTVHVTSAVRRGAHLQVAHCHAFDADDGANSQLTYDIVNVTSTSFSHHFSIGPTSGRLTMRVGTISGSGSWENMTMSVVVRARDGGWPSLSTTETLYITLVNTATELSDTSLIAADLSKEATTVANNVSPVDAHPLSYLPVARQHSVPVKSPQSPITDLHALSTGSVNRKTVRFADQPSSVSDRGRALNDADKHTDVGYTIRPHYPSRVTLSSFHSNPTIASEL